MYDCILNGHSTVEVLSCTNCGMIILQPQYNKSMLCKDTINYCICLTYT